MRWLRGPEVELLVVCTANICRSPAAEALLRAALRRQGLGRRIRVRSAGTAVAVPGTPPDPRMVAIAAEIGVRLRGLRAAPLNEALLRESTAVYVMEPQHLEAVHALSPEAGERAALLDPAGSAIDDPYFGDKAGVRRVFERLLELTEERAREWQQHLAHADRMV